MTAYKQTMTQALQKMYLSEDNVDLMRKAAGGAAQTVKMKDGKLKMDMFTASAIMQVFDKVNPANQKKMAVMINKGTKAGMLKLQSFAMKQVKSEYGEEVELDEARQLKNPKKEVLVVKGGKVVVIDKKDAKEYLNKGWELAEEVDLDEGVDVKDFDSLKKGDTVTIEYKSAMSSGTSTFKVTAKNMVSKGKVEKVTLQSTKNPRGVKHFLYKRDNKVSFAQGDMGASVVSFKKEEVELDEFTVSDVEIAMKKKYGKIDKEAIEKLKKVQHMGNVDRNALVKVGHGKLNVESVDLVEGKMSQLHQHIKDKKSAEEIAKIMKLDVKTIKALMSSYESTDNDTMGENGKYMEMLAAACNGGGALPPSTLDEGAAADARRAMSRDPDFSRKDSADDDDSATDDDIKGASKNIIMQLRKAISLKGRFDVEFLDKKKFKVPAKMAMAVTQKYNSLKKPADKEKFQAQIAKSYKDMLKILKAGYHGEQKESILDRIGKKMQERKEFHEASKSNRWELGGKKFSLINDKGTYILVSQGTGKETKLKATTPQEATQELVKKGYKES